MKIFRRHMVTATGRRICAAARRTFERANVDYDALCGDGVTVEDMRRIRHPLVERVIENARREADRDGET